ncbi:MULTISPECIES: tRNA adenosine(34) deaminase TadA [Carnobacterium]|uniref:tRNA-specific adenosine deaminase n=2 Tax=Carnobacterium divergens TaxID=2748 RepID=A0A0R2I9I2_CARDV|nr:MULTISPECIES: tRNA adenosine(34) deaminase TadA [Carnobacterium]KRN58061.1 tRNA specific adenosine deaminase [Carnobacterium divergens DSM 20623]MDO0874689.1 tRNA adenosine(34) deaminase TadA [Carnobacterium divergens]MDT1940861.1 tRNA adenosine(34) deaminase TadA [Carnobacterium divergens]MDT1943300.1 tRNA adenosine(34) deaminase TadA [Carnobacterium divergens]MDT1949107.1 tRNA adenosine(34) deaminase TadA [Carnobacterium divergens]
MYTQEEKEFFMKEAIKEAQKAGDKLEVPIGAVVVLDGKVIARGHNMREETNDATTHAEMIAIRQANHLLDSWRLEEASLFVTLEPCPMCSGAMIMSRVKEVYYGAEDPKGGTAGTLYNLLTDERFNHQVAVESGILAEECGQLLSEFFKALRQRKKEEKLARKSAEQNKLI